MDISQDKGGLVGFECVTGCWVEFCFLRFGTYLYGLGLFDSVWHLVVQGFWGLGVWPLMIDLAQ
jgi:hypothetical protein